MSDPIAMPTSYTDATLAAYMHDLLGPVATSLGWTTASYQEATIDALLLAGKSTVADMTVTEARLLGAVAAWRRVVRHTAGNYAFSADGASFSRQQVNEMAIGALRDAEFAAMESGLMHTVGVQELVETGDPYQFYPTEYATERLTDE